MSAKPKLSLCCLWWAMLWGMLFSMHAKALTNGSFEQGLGGWQVSGTQQVESVPDHVFLGALQATDGNHVLVLSTGPGVRGGRSASVDGNVVSDFDISAISTTTIHPPNAEFIEFDWAFASSELRDELAFDDVFEITLNGQRLLTGSAPKLRAVSSFPDVSSPNGQAVTLASSGAVQGTQLNRGIPAWQRFCAPLSSRQGELLNLRIRVADQGDRRTDSALLLDRIQLVEHCSAATSLRLQQLTHSEGNVSIAKNGDIIVRFSQSRIPAASQDGNRVLFISSADLGGNPSLLEQVYEYRNGAIRRVSSWTGDNVHSLNVSSNGEYGVISARAQADDNLEIYRVRFLSGDGIGRLEAITQTDDCNNTQPAVSDDGQHIVFLSDCGDGIAPNFNLDGSRELVYWNDTEFTLRETTACNNFNPQIAGSGGRYFVLVSANCNYTQENHDANMEVFRFTHEGGAYTDTQQLTQTNNFSVLDTVAQSRDGQESYFVQRDIAGNFLVHRHRHLLDMAEPLGLGRFDQIPINLKLAEQGDTLQIVYESIDLLAPPSMPALALNVLDPQTQLVSEAFTSNNLLGLAAAADAQGNIRLYFSSSNDPLGSNDDRNLELFSGLFITATQRNKERNAP